MRRCIVLLALGVLVVGCNDGAGASGSPPGSTPAGATILVGGVALAGPTCPVVTDPPDPSCDDRPVASARVRVLDADGAEVDSVVTDEEGRFSIELAPGTYQLVPQPVDGLMGTAEPITIELEAGVEPEPVTLAYDTGIR